MNWKKEWKSLPLIVAVFAASFYLPVGSSRFDTAVNESLHLVKWYAREHVLLCLIPAFFIAGAIGVFVSQASVMRYLGAKANKLLAYGVASVSGSILAVCSCTVLPLFAGIYRMGAGLGPASAFLYSGPAINVLAIFLTARVLSLEMGVARSVGAVVFSVLVGLLMHWIYRGEEAQRVEARMTLPDPPSTRALWKTVLHFASMIAILVFANWGRSSEPAGIWNAIYDLKWLLTSISALGLGAMLVIWFAAPWWKIAATALAVLALAVLFHDNPLIPFTAGFLGLSIITSRSGGELGDWFAQSWGFAKQILPLLMAGVLVAGLLLGRPGHEGLIPSAWISGLVGGNSLWANLFASVAGAFMYFATLTEIPILQGLVGSGMGKGPALALLLAGPALSLPSMLVLRSVMGPQKTVVFVAIVVIMATISGLIYGTLFG
ncbi:MAG: permease [candidate division Zixibacteria bacterium]|nr:permease [candidate division Zixibacteria bacterium]